MGSQNFSLVFLSKIDTILRSRRFHVIFIFIFGAIFFSLINSQETYATVSAGNITANCTTISGTGTETNWPNGGLGVDIRFDTDYPTNSTRDYFTYTNNSGAWSMNVPASLYNGVTHRVYIAIQGKDTSGNDNWIYASPPNHGVTFGPCSGTPPATPPTSYANPVGVITTPTNCTTISGTATDANWPSGTIKIHIRLDTPWPGKQNPDKETFTNSSGQWSWTIPASYINGSSHIIYADIENRDATGEASWDGHAVSNNAITFGPCTGTPPPPPPPPSPPATEVLPVVTITTPTNCTTISGTATDANWPSGGLRVHIRIDAPWPTKPGPDQEVFTNSSGQFSWAIPSWAINSSSHPIYVDVQSKNNTGADITDVWDNATNDGVTFGPCAATPPPPPPSDSLPVITITTPTNCTTVSGTATDADWSGGGLRVHIRFNAPWPNTLEQEVFTNSSGAWSYTIPATYQDASSHGIYVDVQSKNSSGTDVTDAWDSATNDGVTFGPCAASPPTPPASGTIPACGNITYSVQNPEIASTFSVTVSILNPTGAITYTTALYNMRVTVAGTSISNQSYSLNANLAPGATGTATTANITPITPGEYRVTWSLRRISDGAIMSDGDTATSGNQECITSGTNSVGGGGVGGGDGSDMRIVKKPYFKIYSGDMVAGSLMEDATNTCVAPSSTGKIYGFANAATGGGYTFGASSELAVFALNEIKGVYSGSRLGASANYSDNYSLNMSNINLSDNTRINNGTLDSGTYGATIGCIPNYYNRFRTLPATNVLGNNVTINPATAFTASGQYNATGNVTLGNGSAYTIPLGRRIALFVDGNVYINGDIHYAVYSAMTEIPAMWIVATGNIYIDPNTQELETVLAATGTGANQGTIYTCGTSSFAPVLEIPATPGSELYNSCRLVLYVNGGLSAKRIKLNRVARSLNCMRPGSNISAIRDGACDYAWCPWASMNNIVPNIEIPSCYNATEIFKSLAEVMLVTPPFQPSTHQGYERITSMPTIY